MQIDLAKELGIADYPCPAGGCMLTDPVIAARLKDLFAHVPDYNFQDLLFLKFGRHFRINPRLRIILGRNQEENDKIALLAAPGSTLFLPEDFRGPTAILRERDDDADLIVGKIIARYSQDEKKSYLIKKQVRGGEESFFPVTEKYPAEQLDAFRLGRS